MSTTSDRTERLLALVQELLEAAEVEAVVSDDTSLLRSELLDSLALLEIAGWVDDELSGGLDLESTDIRKEWDSVADILAFLDRHA
ncbi:MAG: phosphopantetheine-binding protein [Myxococcota bacterium]